MFKICKFIIKALIAIILSIVGVLLIPVMLIMYMINGFKPSDLFGTLYLWINDSSNEEEP